MPTGIRKLNKGIKNIRLNAANNNQEKKNENSSLDEAKSIEFKAELVWCREQLKNEFDKAKNERRKESLWKAYNILNNDKMSIIRKRQVMNQFCGDYRKQINDEISRVICQNFPVNIRNMSAMVKSSSSNDSQNELNYIFLRKRNKQANNKSQMFDESSCHFKLDLPN